MAVTETLLAGAMLLVLRAQTGSALGSRAAGAALGAALLAPVLAGISDSAGGLGVAASYLAVVGVLYALAGVIRPRERRVLGRALRERRVATEVT
jgi:hypothetical protein